MLHNTPKNLVFPVEARVDGEQIVAEFHPELRDPAYEYAFYLFRNTERLEARWYEKDAYARFKVAHDGAALYYVQGFIRQRGEAKAFSVVRSNLLVAQKGQPLAARTTSPSITGLEPYRLINIASISVTKGVAKRGPKAGSIEYKPRADVKPFVISFPFNWRANPFSDPNWRAQLQMWRQGDFLLREYDEEKKIDSIHDFLALVKDWHRFHIKERQFSTYAWADMIVGSRAMKLAYLISHWQHGKITLDQDDLAILTDLVAHHLLFLLNPDNYKYTNHTVFDVHGLIAIAQVVDQKSREIILSFVKSILEELIARQFTPDGIHRENSVAYHLFGISIFRNIQRFSSFAWPSLDEILKKAERALPWLKLPDGRFAPIGDTDGGLPPADVRTPTFKGSNELFNSSGYLVVRDDGKGRLEDASYFFLMGAFNSVAHKHADCLSVTWFHGEDILCDAGKYAYKNDEIREYFLSRRAHNTVEIDAPSAQQVPDHPYGSAIDAVESHAWGHAIHSSVRFDALDVLHQRLCLFSVDGWLLVMDHLHGKTAHDFTQWSHFAPEIGDFSRTDQGYSATLKNGRQLSLISETRQEPDVTLIQGQVSPRRQGWISRVYAEIEPNAAIGIRQHGASVRFATLYSVEDRGSRLKWIDDQTLRLCLRGQGADLNLDVSHLGHKWQLQNVALDRAVALHR